MKNIFFLKQAYFGLPEVIASLYALFVMALLLGKDISPLPIPTVVAGILFLLAKKRGLYIQQEQISYRTLRHRSIAAHDIIAIKLMPAYFCVHDMGNYLLTDSNRNPLYSIMLLRSLREEMRTFQGDDIEFRQKFWRDIICFSVYDKEAVEYLLYLNPNIEIIL